MELISKDSQGILKKLGKKLVETREETKARAKVTPGKSQGNPKQEPR